MWIKSGIFYFLPIFHIYTVQWLNYKKIKDEINFSYIGGGVAYLLQILVIIINNAVCNSSDAHKQN